MYGQDGIHVDIALLLLSTSGRALQLQRLSPDSGRACVNLSALPSVVKQHLLATAEPPLECKSAVMPQPCHAVSRPLTSCINTCCLSSFRAEGFSCVEPTRCLLANTSFCIHCDYCYCYRAECGDAGTSQSIAMSGVAAHTVEMVLQYVYGCLPPDLTLAEAVALFEASDMYVLSGLHQQCTRLLKALISFDNVFDLAELAQLHDCPSLLQVPSPALLALIQPKSTSLPCACLSNCTAK